MNVAIQQALELVDTRLHHLLNRATNHTIKAKLKNLDEVCRHLVLHARQRLTVPSVVAAYAARVHLPEQSLAESSIRNKRGGANPYQELYRAWESAADIIIRARQTPRGASGEIFSPEEASGISDPVLKHQIMLLIAQNRSLKSQLDILRQVRSAPVVQLVHHPSEENAFLPLDGTLALNESEVEAVKDFVAPNKLRARGLRRTTIGGVETFDGRLIADPGFLEALDKIVKVYRQHDG